MLKAGLGQALTAKTHFVRGRERLIMKGGTEIACNEVECRKVRAWSKEEEEFVLLSESKVPSSKK